MKRIVTLSISLIIALSSTAQENPVVQTLTYSDHEPLGNMRTRFINDVFFAAIEKESNGRLKIDAHWNGEIAISYDALRAVASERKVDMAIVVPEYTPDNFPLHQIFKSFPAGPSGEKQVDFFRRVYAEIPDFNNELEKENVVNILTATGYPTAFFSSKTLNTLDDIRGETFRSASFWHKAFLQNIGAMPITISWGAETYKALQSGTIDGLMVNIDSGHDIDAQKIAPNILVSQELWLGHVYLLVINKDAWNGLSKENQKAIERAAETAYKALGAVMNSSFDAMVEAMKKDGANIRILKSQEVKQWEAATKYKELQAAWVKEQQEKGVKDAGAVTEKISVIISEIHRP